MLSYSDQTFHSWQQNKSQIITTINVANFCMQVLQHIMKLNNSFVHWHISLQHRTLYRNITITYCAYAYSKTMPMIGIVLEWNIQSNYSVFQEELRVEVLMLNYINIIKYTYIHSWIFMNWIKLRVLTHLLITKYKLKRERICSSCNFCTFT